MLQGFEEELKEITWAAGIEYVFQDIFALRTGYFNESLERFPTFPHLSWIEFDFATIDISYLFLPPHAQSFRKHFTLFLEF